MCGRTQNILERDYALAQSALLVTVAAQTPIALLFFGWLWGIWGLLLGVGGCSGMSTRDKDTAIGAGVGGVAGAVLTGGSAVGTVGASQSSVPAPCYQCADSSVVCALAN
jgi:hypothetical protein